MLLAFPNQPLKALFLTYRTFYLLCCLPIWVTANLLPKWRPRRSWSLSRTLIVKTLRFIIESVLYTSIPALPSQDVYASEAHITGFVPIEATPELITGEILEMARINRVKAERTCGFWYGPRGPDSKPGQSASEGEKVVYFIPGGAYVMGTAHPSNSFAVKCITGFLEHFPPDVRVLALEYRRSTAAPLQISNPYPAALIDAIAGYRYLVEDIGFEPQNIIIAGDSAGGNIALSLALYSCYARLPGLPQAGGLLLLSPAADWTISTDPTSSIERNSRSDFLQPFFTTGYTKSAVLGYLPDETAATSIWLGPGSLHLKSPPGAFAQLPPTCIVAGEAEILLDGIRTLRDRIQCDAGNDRVVYIETPDAPHNFLSLGWYEPERTMVLREIGRWAHQILSP
ncbi:hypothetical protein CERSUDRAFT_96472 [Gelatoporia subvermispora B]|uniref:Alpha/beta hydrolase fold-3 domain-containing protein n=1 Tax=Ceriporiopsis subvermispora (strain B) TaxID=914234 RepID=M2QE78_CERS8|nr:hypothetical protein CERSUDRAFT_96472 [Gelatoporia subvermispora B]